MFKNQFCLDGYRMQLKALIKIQNSTFEEWLAFFQSYSAQRSNYVKDEVVLKIGENEAQVSFEVTDIDGLTELSAADDIRLREKELGVITAFID
jgi:hypothetical protein